MGLLGLLLLLIVVLLLYLSCIEFYVGRWWFFVCFCTPFWVHFATCPGSRYNSLISHTLTRSQCAAFPAGEWALVLLVLLIKRFELLDSRACKMMERVFFVQFYTLYHLPAIKMIKRFCVTSPSKDEATYQNLPRTGNTFRVGKWQTNTRKSLEQRMQFTQQCVKSPCARGELRGGNSVHIWLFNCIICYILLNHHIPQMIILCCYYVTSPPNF